MYLFFFKTCEQQWQIMKNMYSFFWVILRGLNFMCRSFGAHCSIFMEEYNIHNIATVWNQEYAEHDRLMLADNS
jgi:hypothetical protein